MTCLRAVDAVFVSTLKSRLIACISRIVRRTLALRSCDPDRPSARRSARIVVTAMSTAYCSASTQPR
jgi:hypothetical protein